MNNHKVNKDSPNIMRSNEKDQDNSSTNIKVANTLNQDKQANKDDQRQDENVGSTENTMGITYR